MRHLLSLLIFSLILTSCWKSKGQLTKELLERKLFWKKKRSYYLDRWVPLDLERHKAVPILPPSDTQIFYQKKFDTAALHLDKIYDSLFQLTGEWYGPDK